MDTGKLRILLLGDYPADPRLGSPKVLYMLRDQFAALGHDADLYLAPELGTNGTSRHVRDVSAPWLAWRALKRSLRAGTRYDVIDASGAEALVIAARRDRTRALYEAVVIGRSHGLEHLNYARMLDDARHGLASRPWYRRVWYPATRMRLVAGAARRADKLIVANETDRAFAAERGWKSADDIALVPHGLSEAFLAEPPSNGDRAGLLFCGSWDAAKGTPYLVEAFGRLCARRSDAQLTILGPGVEPESVVTRFPEPARARVRVVPRSDEARVIAEFQRHAALVMCSTYEGFGMVVPEAMALGLPVIATAVGVASTLVKDGATGVLVPARDADRLALAMERVLDNAPLRASMAVAARDAVRSMTWAESARRTLAVYCTALGSRRVARPAAAVVS